MARDFFVRHGISFEERNVLMNPHVLREMVLKSHQRGVPVIDTGSEIFVGFDRPALEQAFGIRKISKS